MATSTVDISESQWLIQVSGIPGTFQTKTGGDVSVEHQKEFDGGSLVPTISQGKPMLADLTVGRSYQVPRDQQLAAQLEDRLKSGRRFEAAITCTPLDEAQVPCGTAKTFQGTLQKVTSPEGNANSATKSRFELTFTVR